jgi:multiple sugar transport system ATP-binding protein
VTHDQTEAMTMGDRIVVMKDGVIQQAADPNTLYNHPVNLFVAGFIGSPAMNFIPGQFVEEKGALHFKATGIDVVMPEGKAQIIRSKGYVNREVILGVRPEDIHEEPVFLEASPNTVINANIEVAENLGHEMFLYLAGLGKENVIARVDGRSGLQEGQNVKLAIDMNKVHVFDKDTELNIFEND